MVPMPREGASLLDDRQGEPGSAVEQSVHIGSIVIGDVGKPAVETGDASAKVIDVLVQRGKIGAVVAVVPDTVDDLEWVQVVGKYR